MLNNVTNMNIKLTRAAESFYLLAPSDDNKELIKILDATFYHPSRIETPLLLTHANVLAIKREVHYPVTHTQIKTFTSSSVAQQVSIDNARKNSHSILSKHRIRWFCQY
jgi:hypothetical protein